MCSMMMRGCGRDVVQGLEWTQCKVVTEHGRIPLPNSFITKFTPETDREI